MRTTDMLASAGFDMTPTPDDEALASKDFTALLTAAGMPAEARRRLLVWASLKVWTAWAGGAMVGVGSNLLANAAGGKAAAVVGAFAATLGAPMLLTYGLGALAGGVVRQLTKKGVQSYAPSVVSKLSDNPKVMDAFVGSMEYGSQFYDTVLEPNGIKNFGDVTRPKLTRLLGKADLMGKAKGLMAQEAKALAEYQWAEANKGNPEVAALLPDLLRKLDAIRRMGAAAADVSRADWKAAAANVIMETMREEGVGAAQVVVDELAAALAPTPGGWGAAAGVPWRAGWAGLLPGGGGECTAGLQPLSPCARRMRSRGGQPLKPPQLANLHCAGVEPSGLLSAADADTDFDNTSFDESAGASGLPTDIQAGPQADGAPDEPAGEQGGSTPDDSTAGDQGGSTPDDSTAGDQGSDGGAAGDQGGNENDDQGGNENDDQGGNETDDSSNPADDSNQAEEGGGGSTEDEGSSSAGDSDFAGTTADDGGADAWGGSTADAGDAGGFTGTTDASF